MDPPVSPFVSCEVFGRGKKRQCSEKGMENCVFQKKGKWCLPTPSNGGKCADYWKKKTCLRAGAPCTWNGGKKGGSCDLLVTADVEPPAAATGA